MIYRTPEQQREAQLHMFIKEGLKQASVHQLLEEIHRRFAPYKAEDFTEEQIAHLKEMVFERRYPEVVAARKKNRR